MDVSIVVAPRERFSSFARSLDSLFQSIRRDVPVIVIEGGSPAAVRKELLVRRRSRPYEWIALDHMKDTIANSEQAHFALWAPLGVTSGARSGLTEGARTRYRI